MAKSQQLIVCSWEEHLAAIASRYPYPFPPAITKGPHPKVDGVFVPGGKAYTGRKVRKSGDNRSKGGI